MDLQARIEDRSAALVVFGVGEVGLALCVVLATAGFHVVGVEPNAARRTYIEVTESAATTEAELGAELACVLRAGRLQLAAHAAASFADVAFVCVATPVDSAGNPDTGALWAAAQTAAAALRPGGWLIIESTVAPGALRLLHAYLQPAELRLAYVPERVMPGKMLRNLRGMPRVIGVEHGVCAAELHALYTIFVHADLRTVSWATAELVKVGENALRDVNIAFANVLAEMCEQQGASYMEVANSIRMVPGRTLLRPGLVAGACLPKDTLLLATGNAAPLLRDARSVNDAVYARIAAQLRAALDARGMVPTDATVALLGVSYLADVASVAGSPAPKLAECLRAQGLQSRLHDPFLPQYQAPGALEAALRGAHGAIVLAPHALYTQLSPADCAAWLACPVVFWVEPPPASWRAEPAIELLALGEARATQTQTTRS